MKESIYKSYDELPLFLMRYHQYPKQDPIKNYFPLPNELFVLGMSAGEIAIYAFLIRCENWDNYTCVLSYKEIGAAGYSTCSTRKFSVVGQSVGRCRRIEIFLSLKLETSGLSVVSGEGDLLGERRGSNSKPP